MKQKITFRKLEPKEWKLFRDVRLQALLSNPEVYCTNYEVQSKLKNSDWEKMMSLSDCFVLFVDSDIAGIGKISYDDDKKTAYIISGFVLNHYRNQGLGKILFEERVNWVKSEKSEIELIETSCRQSNIAMNKILIKNNFKLVNQEIRKWFDSEDLENLYQLKINNICSIN